MYASAMRYQEKRICPLCHQTYIGGGELCQKCKPPRKQIKGRENNAWYGYEWRKIRARVLIAYGIPKEAWSKYDVDHNPPYNPEIEPDHRMYTLIPRLHADHSRKTAQEDNARDRFGRFGGGNETA